MEIWVVYVGYVGILILACNQNPLKKFKDVKEKRVCVIFELANVKVWQLCSKRQALEFILCNNQEQDTLKLEIWFTAQQARFVTDNVSEIRRKKSWFVQCFNIWKF